MVQDNDVIEYLSVSSDSEIGRVFSRIGTDNRQDSEVRNNSEHVRHGQQPEGDAVGNGSYFFTSNCTKGSLTNLTYYQLQSEDWDTNPNSGS